MLGQHVVGWESRQILYTLRRGHFQYVAQPSRHWDRQDGLVMSSAYPSAEDWQSAVNCFVVDEGIETVHRQLISVSEKCPTRLRVTM